jgi:ssDNA-binding replication factor A large subunit
MTAKKMIEQILATHPEISREQILERLDREKRKTGSFISDDVLLRMVAAEFGVEVSNEARMPTLSIRDLIPGLNDVTVVGRVVAVFPSKAFKSNKSGKVASLLIADENSILRIVLWNDKTEVMESGKVEVGHIIRFSHGYTKEDYSGRVELHVRKRSGIEINPKDAETKDYPTISKFTTKIGEITQSHKNKKVNITGTVKKLFPPSTFRRRDSSSGKVMRFIFADETGEIPVVVWNEKADELEETLRKGVKLQLVNARAKKTIGKGSEIHVNSQTYVEAIKSTEDFSKIADLKEGLKHVNVKGTVVTKQMPRNVKTFKGELVKLTVFEMKDDTGKMWVSAWRKHVDTVSNLKVGDKVIIKNAYVKKGFGEQLEISTRSKTIITIVPQQ